MLPSPRRKKVSYPSWIKAIWLASAHSRCKPPRFSRLLADWVQVWSWLLFSQNFFYFSMFSIIWSSLSFYKFFIFWFILFLKALDFLNFLKFISFFLSLSLFYFFLHFFNFNFSISTFLFFQFFEVFHRLNFLIF